VKGDALLAMIVGKSTSNNRLGSRSQIHPAQENPALENPAQENPARKTRHSLPALPSEIELPAYGICHIGERIIRG